MKTMLLAAGRGERMRPLTDRTPKPLLDIDGRALIEHRLLALAAAGLRDVVINYGYLGEQIPARLGDGRRYGVQIRYSPEPADPLDSGGGLYRALSSGLLGAGPFAVVNADLWCDYPFERLRRHARDLDKSLAHLVLVDNPPHVPGGDFDLGAGGAVANRGDAMLTFSGISVIAPSLFERHDAAVERFSLIPLLRAACDRGRVVGEHYRGDWRDIGTPQRLRELRTAIQRDDP